MKLCILCFLFLYYMNHFKLVNFYFHSTGKPIEYTGDPLQDLTLIRFLDRYVFKNPKKLESKKVAKKNDPLAQRASYTPKGIRTIPVDSLAYLNEREDRIPVDELFLYQYMHKRKELRGVKVKTEDEEDEEDDDDSTSVNSEEFDDMLDRLSKNKGLEELDVAGDFHPAAKKSKGKLMRDQYQKNHSCCMKLTNILNFVYKQVQIQKFSIQVFWLKIYF